MIFYLHNLFNVRLIFHTIYPCKISVLDLQLPVKLGYSFEERSISQIISLNIDLLFPEAPIGAYNDQLTDTYCYDDLVKLVHAVVASKDFKLIEHLGKYIYDAIAQNLKDKNYPKVKLELSVTKILPPLPSVKGGVAFTYKGDLE